MMKRTFNYMVLLVFACLWGCQNEDNSVALPAPEDDCLTLTLKAADQASTRGVPGDDAYNENTVKSVNVYFFNADGSCALASNGLGVDATKQLKVRVSADMYNKAYTIYVVANPADGLSIDANGTLTELEAKVAFSDWKSETNKGDDVKEDCLLMHGSLPNQTINKGGEVTVQLERAMAKVALFPTVADKLEINGLTYTPVLNALYVTLENAVVRTQLDGNYVVTTQNSSADYKSLKRYFNEVDTDGKKTLQHVPFYSYPNSNESLGNDYDSYLLLCVPWTVTDGGSYTAKDYFYRIPITAEQAKALKPNTYYKIQASIGVLGSTDPDTAVELTDCDFLVLEWNNMTLDVEMKKYQYLVLDEYKSYLYNQNEVEVKFVSSSDIDWNQTKVTSVSYEDFGADIIKTVELMGNNIPADYQIEESKEGYLKFSHPINRDMFSVYRIKIHVVNTQGIARDWEVWQYPPIYIYGEYNTDGKNNRFVNNNRQGNNNTANNDKGQSLGGVYDSADTNQNYNQYTINITSLDNNSSYMIGDPRSTNPYNFGNNLGGAITGQKGLTNYKNTITSSDAEMVIAPIFKVASSYGVTMDISYDRAMERCASYQENGYPAGRWRIPTRAEVEFIVGLSEDKRIPRLFGQAGSSTSYWVSNGQYNTSSGFTSGTNGKTGPVRCVYDVWYWGNEKIANPNTFTWGDVE